MPNHKVEDGNWKDELLTERQDTENNIHEELAQQPVYIQRFKSKVVELVDNGVVRRQEIVENLDCCPSLAHKIVNQLKQENVLEVDNR